ncbi:hypothetical protein PIB30_005409 [Stylosanthes scabra]|uniref:Reverse transcriptase domain-containing protein n=1 Tax=Stylosanthes scabra TaxID=79078 RepID=A0ABU6X1C4_9FABA|nr:hypothetical protein [Stylosanthes scabra]
MDAYSVYNQIPIYSGGAEKTAFIYHPNWKLLLQSNTFRTEEHRIHLPNLIDKVFKELIGGILEVYVDNMLVKTKAELGKSFWQTQGTSDAAQSSKHHSLFKLMKKGADFKSTEECEKAFQSFKDYMALSPILVKPEERKPLVLYLTTTEEADIGGKNSDQEKLGAN